MNLELLHNIIDHLEEYTSENSENSIDGFAMWLVNKYFKDDHQEDTSHIEQLDLMLAFQITLLNKTIKKQTKSTISNSQLSSLDGYSFLLHLEQFESLRKMELIEMHNLEAPTGIEVIKRLLSKELVEEFDDVEDKGAKRLKITQKGRDQLEQLKPLINNKFKGFSKSLATEEKLVLASSLKKLLN